MVDWTNGFESPFVDACSASVVSQFFISNNNLSAQKHQGGLNSMDMPPDVVALGVKLASFTQIKMKVEIHQYELLLNS